MFLCVLPGGGSLPFLPPREDGPPVFYLQPCPSFRANGQDLLNDEYRRHTWLSWGLLTSLPRGREGNQTRLAGGRRRLSRPPSSFFFLLMFSFAFWSSRPKGPNSSPCGGSGPEFPTYYSGIERVTAYCQCRLIHI